MVRAPFTAIALAAALALAAAPAHANPRTDRIMAGESWLQGKELEAAIAKAEQHPLGSAENPVRTTMPQGQRLYLSRLRCSDGQAPKFYRQGNVGVGVFGNIVDLYIVTCEGGEPRESKVYMDMYHGGFIETRPVPGFTSAVPLEKPIEASGKVAEPRG